MCPKSATFSHYFHYKNLIFGVPNFKSFSKDTEIVDNYLTYSLLTILLEIGYFPVQFYFRYNSRFLVEERVTNGRKKQGFQALMYLLE